MKTLLLATALIAAPLVAQMTPPADPAAPAAEATTPADTMQPPAADPVPADPAAAPMAAPMPATPADPATAPDPAAAPPAPAAPMAGGQVVFQQPPTVDQAFPPPAAKESYPWCSKTMTDGCKQRRDPK